MTVVANIGLRVAPGKCQEQVTLSLRSVTVALLHVLERPHAQFQEVRVLSLKKGRSVQEMVVGWG